MRSDLFGVFENGRLTGMYSGDRSSFEGRVDIIDLPEDFDGYVGVSKEALDDTGHILPLVDLISKGIIVIDKYHKEENGVILKKTDLELLTEGLLILQETQKIVDGQIVEKTLVEQMSEGLEPVPSGYKLENGSLVPMTTVEKVQANLMALPVGTVLEGTELRGMTLEEEYLAGLLPLPDNLKIVNGQLQNKTGMEICSEMYLTDPNILKVYLRGNIKDTLKKRLHNGFLYLVDGNTYPVDEGAQIAFSAILQAIDSGLILPTIVVRTVGNANIVMTKDEFRVFAQEALSNVFTINMEAWAAKDAIEAANNFEAIWAIYTAYSETTV